MNEPWLEIPIDSYPNLPAMLQSPERRFLFWCGRDVATGKGAVLDVGAFLGASAACLAAGLKDNPNLSEDQRKVYTFDFFEWGPYFKGFLEREDIGEGTDTLPYVRQLWGELDRYMVPYKGDVTAQRWTGDPIEILFVDFTQTWQHHDWVLHELVSKLIIGGTLIHQDYLHTISYWLHVFMEKYRDHFDQISDHIKGSSAAWKLVKPLPEEVFSTPFNELVTLDEINQNLDASIGRYEGTYQTLIRCAKGRFISDAYDNETALKYAKDLAEETRDDERAAPHVQRLIDMIVARTKSDDVRYPDDFFRS